MNFNYNIPPKQRRVRQLVAQFNADEELWFSAQPPQNCVGFWQANTDAR
jgi:hypothetical protein